MGKRIAPSSTTPACFPASDSRTSKTPESGVVLYIRAVASAKKGDTLASIGVVAE
jgi:hypothetical protein